jgi:hypothetical protein
VSWGCNSVSEGQHKPYVHGLCARSLLSGEHRARDVTGDGIKPATFQGPLAMPVGKAGARYPTPSLRRHVLGSNSDDCLAVNQPPVCPTHERGDLIEWNSCQRRGGDATSDQRIGDAIQCLAGGL